jgi:hypothetical protein
MVGDGTGDRLRAATLLALLCALACSDAAAPALDGGASGGGSGGVAGSFDLSRGGTAGRSASASDSGVGPTEVPEGGDPEDSCQNSLDCPIGEVCDPSRSACVECIGDEDCDEDQVCDRSHCYAMCSSDNDCTPTGQLCNPETGHCAECARHSDCAAELHCDGARCAPDLCPGGGTTCSSNAVATCSEAGDRFVAGAPCEARATCTEAGGAAACEPWVCSAGASECSDSTHLVRCRDDGLEVIDTIDCEDMGGLCAGASCRSAECSPSARFCDGDRVRRCADDGLSSSLEAMCTPDQHCQQGACRSGVCEAGEPACNGTIATTCNASGSGFEEGGDDCAVGADPPETCDQGECVPRVCALGESTCEDGSERTCSRTGAAHLTEKVCEPGQVCVRSAICGAPVCTPNASFCGLTLGHELRRCNADGSDYTVENVCTASQVCSTEALDCVTTSVGTCNADACPPCSLSGVVKCCTTNDTCGCSWAPGAYCL